MKTIKEPVKNIALLWRRPQPAKTVYRPMKFLLRTQVEDGLLLYNVVTSEMVLVESAEKIFFDGSATEYDPAMDELIARHFLVPEGFDENKSVRQLRALIKKLEPSRRVNGFTILPTTECNARCYYCFESDHPRCTMTDQIVADTVNYIAEKCRGEPIEITWFGGEPLVGARQISQLCKGLTEKGIKFRSSIVSNAYLFDEGLIRTAKDEWHLSTAQITLDGTEKVYNETKAYVLPKENPYQRVLRNIDALLEQGIAVNIRLNVTTKNTADLNDLIDDLAARFGGRKGFTAYAHSVYEGVGYDPISYDSSMREWVDRQTSILDTKMQEKKLLGSLAKLPEFHLIHCMSDNNSAQLIFPDGTIGKCENMSSRDGVGDIYRGVTDEAMVARYKETKEIPGCADCSLFPACINLAICPETGKCTRAKLDWKLDRYTVLMKDRYQKYLKSETETHPEETVQPECES